MSCLQLLKIGQGLPGTWLANVSTFVLTFVYPQGSAISLTIQVRDGVRSETGGPGKVSLVGSGHTLSRCLVVSALPAFQNVSIPSHSIRVLTRWFIFLFCFEKIETF